MRISWQDYFLQMCYTVAQRSTCLRRKVGAIAVKDNRILATGYNGTPTSVQHCEEVGCLRAKMNVPSGERHEICRGLHAEQNVIIQAAVSGISIKDSTIYCTTQPCLICTKMLINCGVKEIFYTNPYPELLAQEMLKEANIPCTFIEFTPQTSFPL